MLKFAFKFCPVQLKKGNNSVIKHLRVIVLGQNIGHMMATKCVKFHQNSSKNNKVMSNVIVFHNANFQS